MADEKVKVRITPLHGIGGVGEAGDVVMMTPAEAEMYFRDGFVEYVDAKVPDASEEPKVPEVEDHRIMKPQSKRIKK